MCIRDSASTARKPAALTSIRLFSVWSPRSPLAPGASHIGAMSTLYETILWRFGGKLTSRRADVRFNPKNWSKGKDLCMGLTAAAINSDSLSESAYTLCGSNDEWIIVSRPMKIGMNSDSCSSVCWAPRLFSAISLKWCANRLGDKQYSTWAAHWGWQS